MPTKVQRTVWRTYDGAEFAVYEKAAQHELTRDICLRIFGRVDVIDDSKAHAQFIATNRVRIFEVLKEFFEVEDRAKEGTHDKG